MTPVSCLVSFFCYGVTAQIRSSNELTIEQFNRSPVVLIGALNNKWTHRFTASLRFRFRIDQTSATVWVWRSRIARHTGWFPPLIRSVSLNWNKTSPSSHVLLIKPLASRFWLWAGSRSLVLRQLLSSFHESTAGGGDRENCTHGLASHAKLSTPAERPPLYRGPRRARTDPCERILEVLKSICPARSMIH